MFYKSLLKPVLFRFDPEKTHDATKKIAHKTAKSSILTSLVDTVYNFQSSLLSQNFGGLTFRNPIGLAAGFDKNGCLINAMQTLGMGYVEVGSITAQASCGNPKPRAFRLPKDHALINRMGLNNDGAQTIVKRLENKNYSIPAGVNIAKTHNPEITGDEAIADYLFSYKEAQKVADYITVNISCPNTKAGKTFEDPQALDRLLSALQNVNTIDPVPTLVKFSSDLTKPKLRTLLEICESHQIDGYVACNTSSSRNTLRTDKSTLKAIGNGGLSGAPLTNKSLTIVRWIREIIGRRKPVVGVGGINSFKSALQMLQAGANLLQIYTGLIYEGPELVKNINKKLAQYMKKNNLSSLKKL